MQVSACWDVPSERQSSLVMLHNILVLHSTLYCMLYTCVKLGYRYSVHLFTSHNTILLHYTMVIHNTLAFLQLDSATALFSCAMNNTLLQQTTFQLIQEQIISWGTILLAKMVN